MTQLLPIVGSIGSESVHVLGVYINEQYQYVHAVFPNRVALTPLRSFAKIFACPVIADRYRIFCTAVLREAALAVRVDEVPIDDAHLADRIAAARDAIVVPGRRLSPDQSANKLFRALRNPVRRDEVKGLSWFNRKIF